MDFLKEWTYNISLTLIIAAMLSLLSPKGSLGRFYKITVSVFILISFLIPFSGNTDISLPEFEFSEDGASVSDTYENLAEANVKNALESSGFSGCSTECDISLNGDEINIDKVLVKVPKTYDLKEVKDYLFEKTGLVAEVRYSDE